MRPMKPGAARSALAENIAELLRPEIPTATLVPGSESHDAKILAAVLGGAINAALDAIYLEQHGFERTAEESKAIREVFWRHANHATWQMTRSLRASGQLEKIR